MATAVDKAYFAIRAGIVSGAFSPNSHVTAQSLAAATGVSRTPVREAMRRLHAEGLVKFIPHRGAFVRSLDEEEVSKLYDVIVVLETLAAQCCAQHATQPQLDEMADMVARMGDMVEAGKTAADIAELNHAFHRLVLDASDNSWLQSAFGIIIELPKVMHTFNEFDVGELKRSQMQHVELLGAFRERDSLWAGNIMKSHVFAARHVLERQFAAGKVTPMLNAANIDKPRKVPADSLA